MKQMTDGSASRFIVRKGAAQNTWMVWDRITRRPAPNSRERQFMQHLRGAGWVKAFELPHGPRILANLIKKGWVESQQTESGQVYRLTELGLQAKKAPLPIQPSPRTGHDVLIAAQLSDAELASGGRTEDELELKALPPMPSKD
jgi:hypothetical protein